MRYSRYEDKEWIHKALRQATYETGAPSINEFCIAAIKRELNRLKKDGVI